MNCTFSRSLDTGPILRGYQLDERIEGCHLLKRTAQNFCAALRPLDTAVLDVNDPCGGVTALLRLRQCIRVIAQQTQGGTQANPSIAKAIKKENDQKTDAEDKRGSNQNSGESPERPEGNKNQS